MNTTPFYVGLDIGTDSVGYAVTDEQYSLLKFHGEPAWGVTLFDAAAQAADRRGFRTARRRLDRRQARVRLLQGLFAPAIAPIDPRFFIRQAESALYPSDKDEPCALFNDKGYTDADYHRQYPTIHHLIDELMTSDAPHDARLVYLACAWLVAHRGHFLSQIDRNNVDAVTDFALVYRDFAESMAARQYTLPWPEARLAQIEAALRLESGVTRKYRALCQACFDGGRAPKEPTEGFPLNCDELLRALAGGRISARKLFCQEAYDEIESFTLASDDEVLAEIISRLGDDGEVVTHLKALYDWSLLVGVLGGATAISQAKVEVYRRHEADLALLKRVVRRYRPEKYAEFFRDTKGVNYVAYSCHGGDDQTKKIGQEDFCKAVRVLLKGVVPCDEDAPAFEDMLERLEANRFMPKQKTGDNRVIPYQLYWHELDSLLRRAEGYLPFLARRDEDGLSVSDKIRSVFTFRVPYFVGPLGQNGSPKHQWAVRRQPGRVLPWNFEQKIDLDASEEAFINKMTNACTYLPDENVLPRESLLYHRFMVLNEINNLKVNGRAITPAQKQQIFDGVFMASARVTPRRLKDFMAANGIMDRGDEVTGIDETIKSNLKPWLDFRRLMESGALSEADVERIIERRTYSEDARRFARWLEREYPGLPEADRRYIGRLSYRDFGRLSRRFLTQLEGMDRKTGEYTTIMRALWETNDNLMELLSDRYTFREQVEAAQREYYQSNPLTMAERLERMYIPAAVRRPVLRALDITGEIVKAFGHAPERIFVEMARGGLPEQKGVRTKSRSSQLLELYDRIKGDEAAAMRAQLEAMGSEADTRLQSEKLFLYYLQLGRCLYTGQPIDLASLFNDNLYNVDHIYPQSLVKDESILNNKVLVTSQENSRKSNGIVPADVRGRMLPVWQHLNRCGLLGDEKLRRLTRAGDFTPDEKWGFIDRQLTETTQATKAVTELLQELYPDTRIIYVKAQLASDFRQAFDRIKSRDYNDLHHARDAYLNIVAGNVWHEKFTRSWFLKGQPYTLRTTEIFTRPVVVGQRTVWSGAPMLEKVKAVLVKNNAHMTRYAFRRQGGLFDQQPVRKGPGLVPLKKGLDTERYGGYNKAAISFFVLARYTAGKKSDVMFMPVELLIADRYLSDPAFRQEYAVRKISAITGRAVQAVSFPLGERILKVNTVLSLDGYRACITGSKSAGAQIILSGQVPFAASYKEERYLKRLRALSDKLARDPEYAYRPEEDHVTAEENLALYDLYVEKLQSSVYRHRPNHPLETLVAGRERFTALSAVQQAQALLSIHTVFGRLAGGTDLQAIGGVKRAASSQKSSSLSNWLKVNKDVRIIDQSASGLWEVRSMNLLELL